MILNHLKNILTLVCLQFLIIFSINAQEKKVYLTGKVDTSFVQLFNSNELLLASLEPGLNIKVAGKTSVDKNGIFNMVINLDDSLQYLSINFRDNRLNSPTVGQLINASYPRIDRLPEMYLFQAGDSLNVTILKEQRISFSGIGSEKLECQSLIYENPIMPESAAFRSVSISNTGDPLGKLYFDDEIYQLTKKIGMNILQSFRNTMTTSAFQLLQEDLRSRSKYHQLLETALLTMQYPDISKRSLIQQFYLKRLTINNAASLNSGIDIKSPYFSYMIFQQEYLWSSFFQEGLQYKPPTLRDLVTGIVAKYKGELRDKLILESFEKLGSYFIDDSIKLYELADHFMSSREGKIQLLKWKSRMETTFPFRLFDGSDQLHTLADYRGKIVVIDVWFTGCGACRTLSKAMGPIMEIYKDRKDIVFLTVSPDRKQQWATNVAKGIYTHEQTINLHTNGLGWRHPMFEYYGWNSAPNQLIIDQTGKLVSARPPRPDDGAKSAIEFRKIIDSLLKKN